MQGTVEIDVALELPEVRKHRVPGPTLGAERTPLVVIVGRTAIGNHRIDGRAAAQNPSLLIAPCGTALGVPEGGAVEGLELAPKTCGVSEGAAGVTAADVRRHGVARHVDAGFEKGDAVSGV